MNFTHLPKTRNESPITFLNMFRVSRTKLTYCGNFQCNIWRKADESSPYILEEHEELPYDITVLIRYLVKKERIVKEKSVIVEADEVMMNEYADLRMRIDETLR